MGVLQAIINELVENGKQVDEAQIDRMVDAVLAAKRVFVAGAGRSGFAARAFSNRLMHMGATVFFVGEPTTPSIREGDLLVIGSGSGTTAGLVTMAQKAVAEGADVATITMSPEGSIGRLAKTVVVLPGVSNKTEGFVEDEDAVQPTGNSFEQMSWLVYDTVNTKVKRKLGVKEEEMKYRHANLE